MTLPIGGKVLLDTRRHSIPGARSVSLHRSWTMLRRIFRALYGNAAGMGDRLGPLNDVLIALTAKQIGATVVTSNVMEFRRIAAKVPSLRVVAP